MSSPAVTGPAADGLAPFVEYDVLVLGELLVHLVASRDEPLVTASSFTREPGGTPAAVAAGVARLGRRTGLAGLVGADPFGRYLIDALHGYGVDTRHIGVHPRGRTPVAFVGRGAAALPAPDGAESSALPPSDVQTLYYREGGADRLFSPAWLPLPAIRRARLLATSGVSLASALPRAALQAALAEAAAADVTVAFDVNWRPVLWPQPERARDYYHAVLPQVDVLMLSSYELIMLTGGAASSEEGRLERILHAWVERLTVGRTRPLLVALTRGPRGCSYGLWRPGGHGFVVVHVPACDLPVKDRTGAGGAFLAGLLVALLDHLAPGAPDAGPLDLGRLQVGDMAEIFAWANASGALATTRRGALAGLPARTTVLRLVKGQRGS